MLHLPLSLTGSIKPSLLFSNFGCCISKDLLTDYLALILLLHSPKQRHVLKSFITLTRQFLMFPILFSREDIRQAFSVYRLVG